MSVSLLSKKAFGSHHKRETSPYNIQTLFSKQVVRIFELIKQKMLSSSSTKFLLQGNVP